MITQTYENKMVSSLEERMKGKEGIEVLREAIKIMKEDYEKIKKEVKNQQEDED